MFTRIENVCFAGDAFLRHPNFLAYQSIMLPLTLFLKA